LDESSPANVCRPILSKNESKLNSLANIKAMMKTAQQNKSQIDLFSGNSQILQTEQVITPAIHLLHCQ
jgi:hypothetical protein